MAVLGAACHSGDAAASEHFLHVYVCFLHRCCHLGTHTQVPVSASPSRCDIDGIWMLFYSAASHSCQQLLRSARERRRGCRLCLKPHSNPTGSKTPPVWWWPDRFYKTIPDSWDYDQYMPEIHIVLWEISPRSKFWAFIVERIQLPLAKVIDVITMVMCVEWRLKSVLVLKLQTLAWETRSAPVPVSPAPPVLKWSRRHRRTPTARSTAGRRAPATSKLTDYLVLRKVTPSPLPSPHTFPSQVRKINPSSRNTSGSCTVPNVQTVNQSIIYYYPDFFLPQSLSQLAVWEFILKKHI